MNDQLAAESSPPRGDVVHLHVHTTYSLLDGALKLGSDSQPGLIPRAFCA